ncbi:SRPBCC family protein [Lysobacter sp. Hz 25]|uniref:SRPBCC family protein n=1 Tax=Lysobacter sp. Hz 25 TaxID=3383698 RepID=UPI0038D4A0D7
MNPRSTIHTQFVIEREFPASPARTFRAWSDPQAKRRWFVCHDDMANTGYELDFRPGGNELNRVVTPAGTVHLFQARFFDVVPDQRIVYAYDMHVGERHLSISLATVEFEAGGAGTRMRFTEQVVFLDGYQDREERIRGTELGLDRLALLLDEPAVAH